MCAKCLHTANLSINRSNMSTTLEVLSIEPGQFYYDGTGAIIQITLNADPELQKSEYPYIGSNLISYAKDGRYMQEVDTYMPELNLTRKFRGFDSDKATALCITLIMNVDNDGLTDDGFRELLRNSIPTVESD